jgi:hypothetical protein
VASRSASRTLGGGRSLIGVRFDELFPQTELHELERLARGGEPGRARLKLPIEGELRTFVVSADALGRGLGGVVTLRDVTELVKAAELKADFAANASHELRDAHRVDPRGRRDAPGPGTQRPGHEHPADRHCGQQRRTAGGVGQRPAGPVKVGIRRHGTEPGRGRSAGPVRAGLRAVRRGVPASAAAGSSGDRSGGSDDPVGSGVAGAGSAEPGRERHQVCAGRDRDRYQGRAGGNPDGPGQPAPARGGPGARAASDGPGRGDWASRWRINSGSSSGSIRWTGPARAGRCSVARAWAWRSSSTRRGGSGAGSASRASTSREPR